MAKIELTVGRVVWYRAASDESGPHGPHDGDQPQAAMIAGVNDDGTINLGVLSADGTSYSRQNVPLIHDSDDPPQGAYAEWMPYQKGQAAKTEALEKRLEPAALPPSTSEPPVSGD